jgi:primosomal protein N'
MSVFTEYNHRLGLSDECPHCNHKAEAKAWLLFHYESTNMGESYCSGGVKVRIASTCPKCGEISWAHYPDSTLEVLAEMMK